MDKDAIGVIGAYTTKNRMPPPLQIEKFLLKTTHERFFTNDDCTNCGKHATFRKSFHYHTDEIDSVYLCDKCTKKELFPVKKKIN